MKGKLTVCYALKEKIDPRNMPRLEDTLEVYEEPFEADGEFGEFDIEDLLDQVFARFNEPSTNPLLRSRASRESGLRADMRVGDYVVLTLENGENRAYICDILGWKCV